MNKKQIKKINELRALFPSEISVSVLRSEKGDFVAHIHTFKGLVTEGNNFSELVEMVNDAMKTYFEIPEKYIPYMPNYVPPLKAAQAVDVFPVRKVERNLVFPL